MNTVKITLFGAHINSSNLGCQALTYSLLLLLENISRDKKIPLEYNLFEYLPDDTKTKALCNILSIDINKIRTYKMPFICGIKSYIKNFHTEFIMLKVIKQSDLVIDITAGDSFSDIYGYDRFISTSRIKRITELLNVPLVLGPQTYGPYMNKKSEKYAEKILKNANMIIARDAVSAQLATILSGKCVKYTTDLAFQLPFNSKKEQHKTIKIGINISGLLVKEHFEQGIEGTVSLKTDYDKYIDLLLDYLSIDPKYEIYLVSHVEPDYKACKIYHIKYANTSLVPLFDNPIDIKSFLSDLDIFIGARMHATIAAFTSGVVTIPTAYSRKFSGVYNVVDYHRIIELTELDTDEAFYKTKQYILDYNNISSNMKEKSSIIESYRDATYDFFSKAIEK